MLLESFPENHSDTPMIAQWSFNQKGQAEKAGAKQFDVFDPDEHSKWELEATETE